MRNLAALLLLCAVGSARAEDAALAAPPADRARKYYYEDIAQPYFALDPQRPGWYKNVRADSVTAAFPAVKSTSTFRVFVLGGSIARLLSFVDRPGQPGEFGASMRAVIPDRDVQVINCGMPGYESFREAMLEQEILEYSPDLIVFLTGHNEGIASAPIPIWVMKAQERLSRLKAFRALVKTFHPDAEKNKDGGEATYDARDAAFEKNLAANISHARARGVAVAVVVPPRNYREPIELGPTPYDAEMLPGWIRFLSKDWEGARDLWTKSLAAPARPGAPATARRAFTWGLIGRAEEKLGRDGAARAAFDEAAMLDRSAICGGICQGIIRRVAAHEGAFLVEADRMFREKAFPRMPGMETFNDRMHWKPKFNCLVSAEIIAAARARPELKSLPWDDAAIAALKGSCVSPGGPGGDSSIEDDKRTLSYVLMGLSWPSFRHLSSVSVFYLDSFRRRRAEWFADIPLLTVMTQNPQTTTYGLSMAPDAVVVPRFHWHVGEVALLAGDWAGAAKQFESALKLDPSLYWAGLSLATAQALRGDKKRALASIQAAVAAAGSDPNRSELTDSGIALAAAFKLGKSEDVAAADAAFWVAKGEAAVEARRGADAAAAFDKARTLAPSVDQLRSIVQGYARSGAYASYLQLIPDVVKAYPSDPDLLLSWADVLIASGRGPEALVPIAKAEALPLDERQRRYAKVLRSRVAGPGGEAR